jgi:hypothetical protein
MKRITIETLSRPNSLQGMSRQKLPFAIVADAWTYVDGAYMSACNAAMKHSMHSARER